MTTPRVRPWLFYDTAVSNTLILHWNGTAWAKALAG